MIYNTAVIGAGIAGLSLASRLAAKGQTVCLYEKSRGVSGRASTRQLPEGSCDHGAQYMTARHPDFQAQVTQWRADGVVAVWQPRLHIVDSPTDRAPTEQTTPTVRYVGTPKMTSPAAHLAARLNVALSTRIVRIERMGNRWALFDEAGSRTAEAQCLVFAIPPEQILPIIGPHNPQWVDTVRASTMSPCWTVMATTEKCPPPPFDAAFVNRGPLTWIANNASKPGRGTTPIWTLHATADWSRANIDIDPHDAAATLTAAFEEIAGVRVTNTVTHRWLYAKADSPPNTRYLWDPLFKIGAIGDWLLQGNVEGAWLSGRFCADEIM